MFTPDPQEYCPEHWKRRLPLRRGRVVDYLCGCKIALDSGAETLDTPHPTA